MPKPTTDSDDPSPFTRLHITPFDAEFLSVVVPARILPQARNISYHTIETFPDRRFGYVELPTEEADKIKKKLNGAVLRGSKMRVEKARPESVVDIADDAAEEPEVSKKRKKKSKAKEEPEGSKKKRRIDYDVVPGIELEDGRKVKRGWTVTDEDKIREKRNKKSKDKDKDKDSDKKDKKDKKDKQKKREERSKYTDKEECLLKTKLPPTSAAAPPAAAATAAVAEDESDRKKRKKNKGRETVVLHEFANTTKFPTFLKANQPSATGASTTEFVEGKGWVDEEGNVVEAVKVSKKAEKKTKKKAEKEAPPPPPPVEDDTTSSSGSSSDEEEDEDEDSAEDVPKRLAKVVEMAPPSKPSSSKSANAAATAKPVPQDDDSTSSSGSDDSSADEEEDKAKPKETPVKSTTSAVASPVTGSARPKSSSSNLSLTIKIPPVTPGKIHPLEALYKRNKGEAVADGAGESQSFSFFGGGGGDDEDDDMEDEAEGANGLPGGSQGQVPMTPYTQEDFEWRNMRSAAPTPDTAHPSRMKNFWASGADDLDDVEEDEDEHLDTTMAGDDDNDEGMTGAGQDQDQDASGPSGDFRAWFWENRRDLNQSWMKRRKTAGKEKRHRENKSRAAKAL